MANVCSGAGPLGRTVEHPGAIVSYGWQGFILPTWLVDEIQRTTLDAMRPMEQAILRDLQQNATPNRARLDDPDYWSALAAPVGEPVQIAGRQYHKPFEWGPLDEVRFGS